MTETEAMALVERINRELPGHPASYCPDSVDQQVVGIVVLTRQYSGPFFLRSVQDYDEYLTATVVMDRLLQWSR